MDLERTIPYEQTNNPEQLDIFRNQLDQHGRTVISSKIKEMLTKNIILRQYKEKSEAITDYLFSWDYKTGKKHEFDLVLETIAAEDPKLKLIFDFSALRGIKSELVQLQLLTMSAAPTNNHHSPASPQKEESGFFDSLANAGKNMLESVWKAANTVAERWANGVNYVADNLHSISERAKSKFVDVVWLPESLIPIIGKMLQKAESLFDKLYLYGWGGKWGIDCSHLISSMLRAGGILKPHEYKTSSALFHSYQKYKVTANAARAGDLLFRWRWGWWHVEMIVGKPYKNAQWQLCVKTIGSSSDTIKVDPMYNIDGSLATKKNGVAYRERNIESKYQILRPQYENIYKHNQKEKK